MPIMLIHTGGTIGMDQTPDGFAPKAGVVEAALRDLAGAGAAPVSVDLRTLDPLLDSAEATPSDWNRIARTIHEARDTHDGFVVTHGTDTLAYTAAALCMALPGLARPVIVTGAMLPLTVAGSDGRANLQDALRAAETAGPGVRVQFAGRLMHGARVRKSHSRAFDAFEADGSGIAPVVPAAEARLNTVGGHKVGIFSIAPGPCTDLLAFAVERCDGLVLRCYGSGTAPDIPPLRAALALAREREVPVIAVSQCPEGGIRLGTYAAGRVMRENGVIDGRDMTPETAYAKLHYCLSLHTGYAERQAFLSTCLCGELTQQP